MKTSIGPDVTDSCGHHNSAASQGDAMLPGTSNPTSGSVRWWVRVAATSHNVGHNKVTASQGDAMLSSTTNPTLKSSTSPEHLLYGGKKPHEKPTT